MDNILPKRGKTTLDLTLTYAHTEKQSIRSSEPITVQTGPSSFVTFPTLVRQGEASVDTLVTTIGIRHGMTEEIELHARSSAVYSQQKIMTVDSMESAHRTDYLNSWLGITKKIQGDNKTSIALLFSEVAIDEKTENRHSNFKTANIGLTTLKTIDPIVLTNTFAIRTSSSRNISTGVLKPGTLLLISPLIAFAANEKITLLTGFQILRQQPDSIDGRAVDLSRNRTDILMGANFVVDRNDSLNFILKANASGQTGVELKTNWSHRF